MTNEDLEGLVTEEGEAPNAEAAETPSSDDEETAPLDPEEQLEVLTSKLAEAETSLSEAEKTAAEYLDGWKRAQASFANFRKRTEAEQAQWRSAANAQLLSRLLPVLDDFKRAFEAIPEEDRDNPWLSGIRLVQRKVAGILEAENVEPIAVEPHDTFDPNVHEAVLYQEVEGFEEGEVVAEVETGYMLGNRVLRPTVVVVAKGGTKAKAPAKADGQDGEQAEVETSSPESGAEAAEQG
jgi:molecular chaperone GrpE